jgi:hypothetical protein
MIRTVYDRFDEKGCCMRQGFYRAVIVFCGALSAMLLPEQALGIRWEILELGRVHPESVVVFAGFGLLPVAAIGLWKWRFWGFATLLVGTLLIMTTVATHDGLVAGLGWAFLHLVCLGFTALRYFTNAPIPNSNQETRPS